MRPWIVPVAALALSTFAVGCAEEEDQKFQSMDVASGAGPKVAPGVATEVWRVDNRWADVDTDAARLAGMAWPENSGMTWEEKYQAWVQSLDSVEGTSRETFKLKMPYGERELPAPTLDCGEVAYMLRAAFASWYHLPFFVKGWDSQARRAVFAGHFGFVYSDGSPAGSFPKFRNAYKDYEGSWTEGQEWPRDNKLRGRRLGDDDNNPFLVGDDGVERGFGAYADEMFLNKRTGYFLRLVMLYFGSVNLADGSNLVHVTPEALTAGDVLLYRHGKTGTGHTMPVMKVDIISTGKYAPQVASGNIPRRQPKWEPPLWARSRFFNNSAGGDATNSDGDEYYKLGGGLKRWRTPVWRGGRWHADVSELTKPVYIRDDEYDRIKARPEQFKALLVNGSPEETKAVAVAEVEAAREHLRNYPASCSARSNREKAYEGLYAVMQQHFDQTPEQVDAEIRTLEDYVFGELVYEQSKTCCWNSTTNAMYQIVMNHAEKEQAEAQDEGMCVEPTVFKARPGSDGYELFRQHAIEMGVDENGEAWVDKWVTWTEDEPCSQRGVGEDTEEELQGLAYCDLGTPAG